MQQEPTVNILLVDDRQENLLALEAILKPLGHTLVRAQSGREALKRLLEEDFAVILLDVQMPGIDGFETAELIRGRERSKDTPIIFLTAVNTSDMHVFRGYEVGAVDYLLKPIVPEILLSKVQVFVDLHCKAEKIRRQAEQLVAVNEALCNARDDLERRVRERTANLAAANEALQLEIAERKRAEEERAQLLLREQHARAEAEAAVKMRDQFLSIASHELKTPLTSLFGYLQLIQRRMARNGTLEAQNQRLLDVAVEQGTRLGKLVDSLLDIARIQTGQLMISRNVMSLDNLAQRVVGEMQPMFEQHSIRLASGGESLIISGDELRLEQVLHNLVQNAVKYSPQGGAITVTTERRDEYGCIAVADQGIGIPPEALPNLFQRFYRADNADARQISGMGIGLYVVKEIVSLHGGSVDVQSVEGQGSTFTVRLPLRQYDSRPVADVASVVGAGD